MKRVTVTYYTFLTLFFISCVSDRDFDTPILKCSDDIVKNVTITEVQRMYVDKTIQIQEELVLEGYVVSSDKKGNFFNVLHFQDLPNDPANGLQIEIDLRDSHLFYPVGQQVFIKLKGLYLGKSKGVYKIGGVFTSFGNETVGRLPANAVFDHLLVGCNVNMGIQPVVTTIDQLNLGMVHTLVTLNNVELITSEIGLPFANAEEETERTLVDCNDNTIELVNSGYSDFQAEPLPGKRGSITGILLVDNDDFKIVIRNLDDIFFETDRCEDVIDEFTSEFIFISELADPNNNSDARFVELYNSSTAALSLKGWQLVRYTNANTEISSRLDLSGHTIGAMETFLIASSALEFQNIYGLVPDMEGGTNSPADSNGDDTLVLLDPFGTEIDIFGRIGEDGSGTDHEFEDGRAVRKFGITKATSVFNPMEWTIYNDTGNVGTINEPQNAPDDFTPGER